MGSDLDEDGSGFISFNEIEDHLQSEAVQEYFKAIDVDPSEAKHLFEMLDINGSGEIDLEEFLSGCLRLQGPAKALDLLLVTRENRRFFYKVETQMARILSLLKRGVSAKPLSSTLK